VPKYDYRCSAGHQYEKREGFDAPAVQTCEVCGIEARRVLTPPAIVFKGSGWYVTDSRKSGASESAAAAGSGAASDSTATATETKTESKTESKGESKPSASTASAGSLAAD
jgi:putative FmdB family regulatory protein